MVSTRNITARTLMAVVAVLLMLTAADVAGAQAPGVRHATLEEANQKTPEVSTDELQRILATGDAVVLDARPYMEFAVSHIPGAQNVAPKPGVPISMYVSDVKEVDRLVGGDKGKPLVLYCNGPFCGKSKRLSEELLAAGFTNVRRYQLGYPVWRALVGLTEIERDAIRHILQQDRTAVFIDARSAEEFSAGSVPGAQASPRAPCRPARTSARYEKPRTTAACPWKTITRGSSSSAGTQPRPASSPRPSRARPFTTSRTFPALSTRCSLW